MRHRATALATARPLALPAALTRLRLRTIRNLDIDDFINRAFGHGRVQRRRHLHFLADFQTFQHMDHAVVVQTDLHIAPFHTVRRLHIDDGLPADLHNTLDRNVFRLFMLFDDDFRLAVHTGLQHVAAAFQFNLRRIDLQVRIHEHALRVRQRRDTDDLAVENLPRQRVDAHAARQTDVDFLQVRLMDFDFRHEDVTDRQIDQFLPFIDLLTFRKRLRVHPAERPLRTRRINDLSIRRRHDLALSNLVYHLLQTALLAVQLQFAGPQCRLRLHDACARTALRTFQRHLALRDIALQLCDLPLVRIVFQQRQIVLGGFQIQFVAMAAQLVGTVFRFGQVLLFIEFGRPFELVLRAFQFLFRQRHTALRLVQILWEFTVFVFNQILFRETQIQLRLVDVRLGLVLHDFQILLRLDIGGFGVLDRDVLIQTVVRQRRRIQFDQQVVLLDAFAFGADVQDGHTAFHLALDRDLLTRLHAAGFQQVDDQRPFFDLRVDHRLLRARLRGLLLLVVTVAEVPHAAYDGDRQQKLEQALDEFHDCFLLIATILF